MYNRLAKLNLPPSCFLLREDEKYKKPNSAATTTAIDDTVMITVFVVFFPPSPVAHQSSYNIALVCLNLLSPQIIDISYIYNNKRHKKLPKL